MSYYLLDNEDSTLGIKNNQYPDNKKICPSKMSDGRFLTDYRPKCIVNQELNDSLVKQNIKNSSYDSRMYIQNNGIEMIEEQYKKTYEKSANCAPCKMSLKEKGTMLPERYVVRCDNVSCVRKEINPNGLGDGRNFS